MGAYKFEDFEPQIHPTAFIAPGAVVVGRVEVGPGASVWFNAVIRGDTERIVVGAGTNIQDGAVLHADPGDPCILGPNVTIAHHAVVHGCTIEEGALIGIGAVVLNKAKIGAGAVVAAGAVVTAGTEVPAGMLAMGIPAKVGKSTEPPQNAQRYQTLAKRYIQGLQSLAPLRQYRLTLRGQDALNPFSDLHMALKRDNPASLVLLRSVSEKRFEAIDLELAQALIREGLLQG